MALQLLVSGGAKDGTTLTFPEGATRRMGTAPDCDLVVEAGHLESVHATAVRRGGELFISDAGSVAGTFVNGEKVSGERTLNVGDRVCLGPPGFKGSVKLSVTQGEEAEGDAVLLDPADYAPSADAFVVEEAAPLEFQPEAEPDFGASAAPLDFGAAEPPAGGGDDWTLAAGETVAEVVEEEPAPAEPAPPPPRAPVAPAPPPPPAKPAARPKYTDSAPSMVAESDEEAEPAPRLPPPPRAAPPPAASPKQAASRGNLPRILAINGAVAVVAIGGLLAWRAFRPPAPKVAELSPARARAGETVTLKGSGFSGEYTVHFGPEAVAASEVKDDAVTAAVPRSLGQRGPDTVEVTLEGPGGISPAFTLTILRGPVITALVPAVAESGATVTIQGENLKDPEVTFGAQPADVVSATPTQIQVVVPALTEAIGQKVPVRVKAGGQTSPPADLVVGRLPMLTAVAPDGVPPSTVVKLAGLGFDPEPTANAVTVGAMPALVVAANEKELTVVVPPVPGAGQVEVPVTVSVGGSTSPVLRMRVTTSLAPTFTPHFYAAPGPAGQAAVATEMGPVLRIASKGSATSTGDRAVQFANQLNGVFQLATTGSEQTVTASGASIVIGGQMSALGTVTPEDAAAYSGRKVLSPSDVAAYWAALIQDYLAVFVYNQRPTHLIQFTPQAKGLIDLQAAAARRVGPEGGIPTTMVWPPPADVAKLVGELALGPAGGAATAAQAGVVLVGLWEGSATDPTGTQQIRVNIALDGAKLRGSMITVAQSASMERPLRKLAFDKGIVKFSVDVGSGSAQFEGRLDGRSISGTVKTDRGAGTFTLQFVG